MEKRTNEYFEKENAECWILSLFGNEKRSLPFLRPQDNIAEHEIEIITFNPKPYDRPYKTEKISEDEETITSKKIFLSDYKGDVDTRLFVRYLGGWDSESRQIAYFLDGDMKEAYSNYGDHLKDAKAFKKNLTDYFKADPSFGENLSNLIKNSNLPEKQRNAVKCLIE